jgi:hypothetical protein
VLVSAVLDLHPDEHGFAELRLGPTVGRTRPARHRRQHVRPDARPGTPAAAARVAAPWRRAGRQCYSVPPGYAAQTVTVRARLGDVHLEIYSQAGRRIARHRRAPNGAGQVLRSPEHARLLEQAVLARFSTTKQCPRKPNRPPGEHARGGGPVTRPDPGGVVVDLDQYAQIARVAGGQR